LSRKILHAMACRIFLVDGIARRYGTRMPALVQPPGLGQRLHALGGRVEPAFVRVEQEPAPTFRNTRLGSLVGSSRNGTSTRRHLAWTASAPVHTAV
jgi:hypothetical protein